MLTCNSDPMLNCIALILSPRQVDLEIVIIGEVLLLVSPLEVVIRALIELIVL